MGADAPMGARFWRTSGYFRSTPRSYAGAWRLLYRRLYEYGVRLTMRQMTGHLAYAITGGRTCEELAKRSWIARAEADTGALFFNLFFGDDGDQPLPEAGQLVPIQRVREAGVWRDARSTLRAQRAWMKGGDGLPLHGSAQAVFQRLRQPCQGDDGAEGYAGACGAPVRRQARRPRPLLRLSRRRERQTLSLHLHQSPMLLESMRFAPGTDTMPRPGASSSRACAGAAGVLHGDTPSPRIREWTISYITLNRRDGNAATQVVLADFRAEEFRIEVLPRYQGVPHTGGIWRLRHESGGSDGSRPLLPRLRGTALRG